MKKYIQLIAICFLISIIAISAKKITGEEDVKIPASADNLENPFPNDLKATAKGARIYKKICWVCHGDNGDGMGPQAAELKTKPADFNSDLVVTRTDGALFWWIENGGNDMQPYRDVLSADDIWMTVNFVRKNPGEIIKTLNICIVNLFYLALD